MQPKVPDSKAPALEVRLVDVVGKDTELEHDASGHEDLSGTLPQRREVVDDESLGLAALP